MDGSADPDRHPQELEGGLPEEDQPGDDRPGEGEDGDHVGME